MMLIEHLLHALLRRGAEGAQRAALWSWRGERGALTQPEQWLSFFIEHLLCPGNQGQGRSEPDAALGPRRDPMGVNRSPRIRAGPAGRVLVWPQEGLWGPSGPELRRAAAHPEAEEPGHNASCVPLTGQLPAAGPGLRPLPARQLSCGGAWGQWGARGVRPAGLGPRGGGASAVRELARPHSGSTARPAGGL